MIVPTLMLAAITFWLGRSAEQRLVARSSRLLFLAISVVLAVPGVVYVLYYTHLFDRAAWFYELRTILGSELLASGIGVLAGFLYSWSAPEGKGEKLAIPAALVVLTFIPFMKPLIAPLDFSTLHDRCDEEACLQSTPSTCGPTSAANLSKLFGVVTSEKELARAAYTYRGGTENWYLARALNQRGIATRVVIQNETDAPPAPSIAGVVLPGGAGHFIAVVSITDDAVTVIDPLVGKLIIPKSSLHQRYKFTGYFLVLYPLLM
ncbi:MAG TPA: cysteine peptidase family C39 domain-containing protein [Terriglobales bacterium]|nr:cysteine peptidase family C39 domain-containing protein [Terriglobales bacterium]